MARRWRAAAALAVAGTVIAGCNTIDSDGSSTSTTVSSTTGSSTTGSSTTGSSTTGSSTTVSSTSGTTSNTIAPIPSDVVAPFPNDGTNTIADVGEFQMDSVFASIEWYSAPLQDLDVADGVTSKTYGQADDPSPYYDDQLEVIDAARRCVDEAMARDQPDQPAVVFDVDDTTLSSFWLTQLQGFGYDRWLQNSMYLYSADPAIEPTLEWFNDLVEQGVQPILITGRSETVTVTSPIDGSTSSLAVGPATIVNLRRAGFVTGGPNNPDDDGYLLFFQPSDRSSGVATFKSDTRAQLAEEFDLIGNVGDQISDLTNADGTVAPPIECNYKLPNPYYFIPGG